MRRIAIRIAAVAGVLFAQVSTAFAQEIPGTSDLPSWVLTAIDYGVKVVGALLAFFIARIVANWLRKLVVAGLEGRKFDATLTRFFGNITKYAILTSAILGILGMFGIQTASFAAVIAAAGLAIGLAFQGTLSNFSAGVMLLIFRPFKVGDVVKCAGEIGTVHEIDLFTTVVHTFDNRQITLPNGEIFGNKIENLSALSVRRVDVDVGADYAADVDETREVLEKAIVDIPGRIDEPESQVFLAELGGSSVNWQLRVWCNASDYWPVHQATVRAAKYALDSAGIGIPFPQMDVHLDESVVKAIGK